MPQILRERTPIRIDPRIGIHIRACERSVAITSKICFQSAHTHPLTQMLKSNSTEVRFRYEHTYNPTTNSPSPQPHYPSTHTAPPPHYE